MTPFPVFGAAGTSVAEVNGDVITEEELVSALGAQLRALEKQMYDLKRRKVEAMVEERLIAREAERRGVSVDALIQTEVNRKAGAVSEEQIDRFYAANKARLGTGDPVAFRDQIRGHLQNQRIAERRNGFIQKLRSRARVLINLEEPAPFYAAVTTEGAPFKGPADARITIVEFTDFHCPYCKTVLSTLAEVRERYGDKVRIVFRDFPLDSLHPLARPAAEAARCAQDQDKFWQYHDALFERAPQASREQLRTYAAQVGLDVPKFESCLSIRAHSAVVQRDVEEGMRLGVTGTPAFFINGRMISGAQPLERFVAIIEEELKRSR